MTDPKFIFIVSIVLGLTVPTFSQTLQPFLVVFLIIMMTVSIKDVGLRHIEKQHIKTIIGLIALNYIALTGTYIITALAFIEQPEYQKGIIMLGLMPPAIGIIALSHILRGNTKVAFVAEFIGYIVGVILVPVLTAIMFQDAVSSWEILKVMLLVIVLPFFLSRIIHVWEKKDHPIPSDISRLVVNIMYGISFYIIIGINKDTILTNWNELIPLFVILAIIRFGFGITIFLYLKNRIPKNLDVLYVLFGTMKNGGAGTAITLVLFGTLATVPFAVNAVLVIIYILFLEWFILHKFK